MIWLDRNRQIQQVHTFNFASEISAESSIYGVFNLSRHFKPSHNFWLTEVTETWHQKFDSLIIWSMIMYRNSCKLDVSKDSIYERYSHEIILTSSSFLFLLPHFFVFLIHSIFLSSFSLLFFFPLFFRLSLSWASRLSSFSLSTFSLSAFALFAPKRLN